MKKYKLGIVTFHCSYNFGSALQAFALCEYLRKQNYDTEIIDFRSRDFEKYKLFKYKLYSKYPQALITDILRLKRNFKRRRNYLNFWNNYFKMSSQKYTEKTSLKELNEIYDAFLCGSDQIWNPNCTNGVIGTYFLDFADKLKIAYAPSIAEENIRDSDLKLMIDLIERLDYISVREESSIPLLEQFLSKPVYNVLDPTLLLEKEDYESMLEKKEEKKYLLIYALEDNEEVYKYAEEIAVNKGIGIQYFSKTNRNFRVESYNYYYEGPQYFVNAIAHATYVISNSFHATVFSVIFEKKFITFPTKNSSSRMTNFLESIGLGERIYSEKIDVDKEINYVMAQREISKRKIESQEYLKNALKDLGK